jgi:hypothetical protein
MTGGLRPSVERTKRVLLRAITCFRCDKSKFSQNLCFLRENLCLNVFVVIIYVQQHLRKMKLHVIHEHESSDMFQQ